MSEAVGIRPGDRVCVTGAGGYVGSHVVRELLRGGYRVRATVRDPLDRVKNGHLHRLAEEAGGEVELVAADLLQPGSFGAAVADCPYVCHVASVVKLQARDPQREIVDPIVKGIRNVLRAIDEAGVCRRLVLTSSIATVVDDRRAQEREFDERDWNEGASLRRGPYPLAKVRAERLAQAHAETATYDLVTVNPTVILGPVLSSAHADGSPALIRDIFNGKYPLVPDLRFTVVDVRDVARAHVAALEHAGAGGRYVLSSGPATLRDIAAVMRRRFPEGRTPRFGMPNALLYAAALIDRRITVAWCRRNVRPPLRLNSHKSREELGLRYRSVDETVVDTVQSLLDLRLG